MIIIRGAVIDMKNRVESHPDFGSNGHDSGTHLDVDFVKELTRYINTGPETIIVPEAIIRFCEFSLLFDIFQGQGRPLLYLCSDCRYPKWCMTPEEVKFNYSHVEAYMKMIPRPDGFMDVSGACPKCGD